MPPDAAGRSADVVSRVLALVVQIAPTAEATAGIEAGPPLAAEGLWLDSATLLELALGCEAEFGVAFDGEIDLGADEVRTVGSLAATVERRLRLARDGAPGP